MKNTVTLVGFAGNNPEVRETPSGARITSLSLAGGVNELLYSEILHGASARLPERLPDLIFWITLPFLGAERATEERARVRKANRNT